MIKKYSSPLILSILTLAALWSNQSLAVEHSTVSIKAAAKAEACGIQLSGNLHAIKLFDVLTDVHPLIDDELAKAPIEQLPSEVTQIILEPPRKKLSVGISWTFPFVTFKWEESPLPQQNFRIQDSTFWVPAIKNPASENEVRLALAKAIHEALTPYWNVFTNPIKHNERMADAVRYHGERIHQLAEELRRDHNLDIGKVKKKNPLRRLLLREFVMRFIPGWWGTKRASMNQPLLNLFEKGEPIEIQNSIDRDVTRARWLGGMNWIKAHTALVLTLLTAYALMNNSDALLLLFNISDMFMEGVEILLATNSSESFSIFTPKEVTFSNNLGFLLANFPDIKEVAAARDNALLEGQDSGEITQLLQNFVWDVELILEDAKNISQAKLAEVRSELELAGVTAFVESLNLPES